VIDQPLVTLEHLSVGYGRTTVLPDLQITFKRGNFLGLLGANGSGKSTLIKTILGIIPPISGSIRLHPIDGHEPRLGYVPQRESFDPLYLLSSFEVVLMGATQRVPPGRRFGAEEKQLALDCLEQAGARNLIRNRFSELSGGQKQRVLIARALTTKPDLLVLDEPTAGIDAAAAEAIMQLLERLHQKQQMTILMVNHDLHAVRKLVQEVIWLHEGKLLRGPVSELLKPEKIQEILDLQLG
jgi:manganese/zinc/iron transport system ATP- binding protein